MFERFTDRVRRALIAAQSEARSLGHDHLGPEHILIGLLHVGDGVAFGVLTEAGISYEQARRVVEDSEVADMPPALDADALSTLGIDLDAIRQTVDATFGDGAFDKAVSRPDETEPSQSRFGSFLLSGRGRAAFTERAKGVLQRALQEALALNHHYIGTEHVLLALLEERSGKTAAILGRVPAADLRTMVLNRLRKAS